MDSLPLERIVDLLDGPHQAVLSVSRTDKGPVAVPMSYVFDGTRFVMVTSPGSGDGPPISDHLSVGEERVVDSAVV